MKLNINAPVLIVLFTLLLLITSPSGSLKVKFSAALKPVVKEVAFNGRTKYTRAKNVTELDAAEKTDVIFWAHFETVSEEK